MNDERDEQGETFNQDQQEMFQNPDTSPGETRPPTPGTLNPTPTAPVDEDSSEAHESGS
ncbi:MAG TPA: hypothetical protein VF634_06675 [Pyrinomonadaceae bacterium]|jgi:hypothetical protein